MGVSYNPNLFLAGLPIGVTRAELLTMFEHANIEASFINIVRNKSGVQMRRAIAFVRLTHPHDTDLAIKLLNRVKMADHEISVKRFVENSQRYLARAAFHSVPHPTWNVTEAAQREAGAQ